jgi:hypothetical protein
VTLVFGAGSGAFPIWSFGAWVSGFAAGATVAAATQTYVLPGLTSLHAMLGRVDTWGWDATSLADASV